MRWYNPVRWVRWLWWKFVSVCLAGEEGVFCARCPRRRFDYQLGICRVYLLIEGSPCALRVSPWDECLIEPLEDEVQVSDVYALHELAEQMRREDDDEGSKAEDPESTEG